MSLLKPHRQKIPFLCISGSLGAGESPYLLLLSAVPENDKTEDLDNRWNPDRAEYFRDLFLFRSWICDSLFVKLSWKPRRPISSQDVKYCASLSRDIDEEKTDTREDTRKLWNNFLSANFGKTSHSSRMAYMLQVALTY
jgi:hypothetical protein